MGISILLFPPQDADRIATPFLLCESLRSPRLCVRFFFQPTLVFYRVSTPSISTSTCTTGFTFSSQLLGSLIPHSM